MTFALAERIVSPGSQTGAPSTADLRRASHRESASHEVAFGEALRRLGTYAGMTPKPPAHADGVQPVQPVIEPSGSQLSACRPDECVSVTMASGPSS